MIVAPATIAIVMNETPFSEVVQIVEAPDVKEYSITQVAELLNVDRTTVWRWVDQGVFDNVRRKGFGETSPYAIPEPSVKKVAKQLGVPWEDDGNK